MPPVKAEKIPLFFSQSEPKIRPPVFVSSEKESPVRSPVVALVLALGLVLTIAVGSGAAAGGNAGPRRDHDRGHWFKRACGDPSAGVGACGAQVVTNSAGTPLVTSTTPPPGAYGPAQFHTAYALPTTAPSTQTIGIVDAYDDPNIEADLGELRRPVRAGRVHDGERLLPQGEPDRRHDLPRDRRRAGRSRSPSTSRPPTRSARTARSCSSRRARPRSRTSAPPRTKRWRSAPT